MLSRAQRARRGSELDADDVGTIRRTDLETPTHGTIL
jgi:hypothetical protein